VRIHEWTSGATDVNTRNVVPFSADAKTPVAERESLASPERQARTRVYAVADQLRAGQFKIEDVIESLSDGFALYDPEDRLVLWNTRFAEILAHANDIMYPGIPFETLVKKCAQEHFLGGLITEAQRDAWIDEARRYHHNGETYERLTPNGKSYLVSRRISPEGFTAVVWTENTNQRHAQLALQESEQAYRALFERSAQGIVVQSARRFIKANAALARIFCLASPEEIRSPRDLDRLIIPGDRSRLQHIRRQHLRGSHDVTDLDLQGIRRDGQHVWLHVTVTPIQWKDEHALQLAFLDITESKRFAEDLIALKLESIGVMARGIAMEFQKLQSAIMSQVRIAKMESYAMGQETIYNALTIAERFGGDLEELIQQLLYLYRAGSPLKETTRVEELIRSSLPPSITDSNGVLPMKRNRVSVRIEFAGNLDPVWVDKGQMIQALHLLIDQGIKSMPFGGELTVSAENVEVQEKKKSAPVMPGKYVRVTITDQGPGVPANVLARLFDPYFPTRNEPPGMALASAFSIVKNHGGTITVHSREGKGTRMNVFLPTQDATGHR
jgi:PAS domain S-box-containing protein